MIHNHRPPSLILLISIFYLLCFQTVASPPAARCNESVYGKPEKNDCRLLFDKFTAPQNLQARFFDEEQLRADSEDAWPGVDNVFQQPIVQLPKFFAMSMFTWIVLQRAVLRVVLMTAPTADTCNFALMPYTNPATRQVRPLDISSWGSIKAEGEVLIHDCLDQKSVGGEISISSSTYPQLFSPSRPKITPFSFMAHVEC